MIKPMEMCIRDRGYMVVTGANIVNEVESMKILFDADAVLSLIHI